MHGYDQGASMDSRISWTKTDAETKQHGAHLKIMFQEGKRLSKIITHIPKTNIYLTYHS